MAMKHDVCMESAVNVSPLSDADFLSPTPKIITSKPAPFGLMAFGITTLLHNFHNIGATESGTVNLVACYGFFHAGFVQLLAGMWEIYSGRIFEGTTLWTLSAFWLGIGLSDLFVLTGKITVVDIHAGKAIWLCIWGVFCTCMFFATLRANRVVQIMYFTLPLMLFLLAGGEYNETCLKIAGYVGIVCGSSALYLGWAELMSDVYGKDVIPVFKVKTD
eukprot:CFRG6088T1